MTIDSEPPGFVANNETNELRWVAPTDAASTLTHQEDIRLIQTIYPRNSRIERWLRIQRFFLHGFLRTRAIHRLATDIEAYEIELTNRAQKSTELARGLPHLSKGLVRAKRAAQDFQVDAGWKFLRAVQRSELLYLEPEHLGTIALAMRSEAGKLNPWRKSAVLSLLGSTEAAKPELDAVFRAAALRDEHYHNEAYKDSLRRQMILMLACFLVAALFAILSSDASLWPTLNDKLSDPTPGFLKLLCLIGLLGSVVSAITDLVQPQNSARIPEMTSTLRVTLIRLFIGPASALALFFAAKASLGVQVTGSYSMLVLAFAGGFSERLVLRVVRSITPSDKTEN